MVFFFLLLFVNIAAFTYLSTFKGTAKMVYVFDSSVLTFFPDSFVGITCLSVDKYNVSFQKVRSILYVTFGPTQKSSLSLFLILAFP